MGRKVKDSDYSICPERKVCKFYQADNEEGCIHRCIIRQVTPGRRRPVITMPSRWAGERVRVTLMPEDRPITSEPIEEFVYSSKDSTPEFKITEEPEIASINSDGDLEMGVCPQCGSKPLRGYCMNCKDYVDKIVARMVK